MHLSWNGCSSTTMCATHPQLTRDIHVRMPLGPLGVLLPLSAVPYA